jgi:O-antigen/teichoic acid export membrane protein
LKAIVSKISKEKNVHSLTQQIITSGIGFISFVILAKYLDKNNFGMWLLYITGCSFVDMLRNGLTQTAVVRFLSGASAENQKKIIGSNWLINLIIAVSLSVIVFVTYRIFNNSISNSGYLFFFKFYPIYVLLNLPSINSQSILQAKQRFDLILFIKSFELGLFLMFILSSLFFFKFNVAELITGQLIIMGTSSLICMILGWDGIKYFTKANRETNRMILNFGKYSTGTLIGTNLLRSADTFIIGLSSILGPSAVALYGIPLKMIEVIEVPLRSFSATLFPRLSKNSIDNNKQEFKKLFYTYSGALTFLIIPLVIIGFIFAEDFMLLIGGKEYAGSTIIFRVFMIYGLMLPLDRFIGISLDSLNKPKLNFYKILFMMTANIIGDLIAVFVFESLLVVAIITIVFSILGLFVGFYYLNREITIDKHKFISEGIRFYFEFFNKIKRISKSNN